MPVGVWPRRHATTKSSDLLLWDLEQGRCKHILVGHTGDLHPFHFSPDSKRLVSSAGDRVVRVWDVRTGHCVELRQAYERSEFPGTPVFLDNDRVAVGSFGGHKLTVWDIADRRVLERFGPAATKWDSWHSTAARSDGKMVALTGHTGKVSLWEHEKFTTFAGHKHGYAIRFQPNSHLLATAYETKVRFWDTRTRAQVAEVDLPDGTQTPCLAFSPDGNLLVCGATHGKARLYDVSALRRPLR